MAGIDNKIGVKPAVRGAISNMAKAMSGDITIEILTAVKTPLPTAAIWDYDVSFQIIDASGEVHDWANQNIVAAVATDSSAGTPAIDDATPALMNGQGSVSVSGDAAAWLDEEVVTLTLSGTVLGKTLASKTWTVTFTAAE